MTLTSPARNGHHAHQLPCPAWCRSHTGGGHSSDWRTWHGGSADGVPAISLQAVRHDYHEQDALQVGGIDFTVRLDGEETGFITCDGARALARWLLALAEQFDPDHLDGEPAEWHRAAPSWVLSPLDWRAHAVDPAADHPLGVWIARCGHHVNAAAPLCAQPPGHRCPNCARWVTR